MSALHAAEAAAAAGPRPRLEVDADQLERFYDALFRYAPDNTFISLRAFDEDRAATAPLRKRGCRIINGCRDAIVQDIVSVASFAANHPKRAVFAPPVVLLRNPTTAAEADVACGVALGVELDQRPNDARRFLESLLGAATVTVASGGTWVDAETGEIQDRLHVHWRLSEPTTCAENHARLKEARRMAQQLVAADGSAVPLVHPLRWPGSWHRKAEPKLAQIVAEYPNAEIDLDEALELLSEAWGSRKPNGTGGGASWTGAGAECSAEILHQLAEIIPNPDLPRDQWNTFGMAFWAASGGSEDGLAAFRTFSAKSAKHGTQSADGAAVRWAGITKSPPTRIGLTFLINAARRVDPDFPDPRAAHPAQALLNKVGEAVPAEWKKVLKAAVTELNEKHFVVPVSGQTVIASMENDPVLKREHLVFSQERDIRLRYKHRHFHVGFTAKGNPIWKDLGSAWIEHPKRRNYDRIALIPKGPCPPTTFNLWRGLGVEPKPGNWPLIKQHLLEVVCCGDLVSYDWMVGWLARAVQFPELHAEVAVVLRGLKGTGKGTLGQMLYRIFRHHALQISNPAHFTGRFNGHLADVLYLFVDEAFWGGDRAGEGTLKGLVTEATIAIEQKFVNVYQVQNRLKILMASNNDWVVPATADERRYFVLDVADCRKGDRAYFNRLNEAISGTELPAFLDYLLGFDISDFDFRNPPHTAALNNQKIVGADSLTKFWLDCLTAGAIVGTEMSAWPSYVATQLLHAAYIDHAHDHGDRHPPPAAIMIKRLKELMPGGRLRAYRPRQGTGDRPPSYQLDHLEQCRAAFLKAQNIETYEWPEDDE